MAFDADAYLASKGAGDFDPDAYLAANDRPVPPMLARPLSPVPDEQFTIGGADKPTKFVQPPPALPPSEEWDKKPWTAKLVDLARGRSPIQTQAGIDETLAGADAGPGTSRYSHLENVNKVKAAGAGMFAGAGAGAMASRALAPLVTTLPGRVAAGALSTSYGGGVGAATDKLTEGGSPGEVLDAGKRGASVGALVGAPLSLAGEGVAALAKNAPTRVAESELAGLKEGVQYKTRIQKFEPNEDAIRAAMNANPEMRATIKTDARVAQPMVEAKFKQVADQSLAPFYEQMAKSGTDGVSADLVIEQLKAARGGFNPIAEKSQLAVLDSVIEDVTKMAAENGGKLPAQFLRETATAFQGQGYSNLPMFGPVQLSKQLKQDVGNGIRQAIADHVEGLAADPAQGKALRQAFEDGNREVALWYRIKDIVDEKARRLGANASPMGDLVAGANRFRHAVKNPWSAAADAALGPLPEAVDRSVLAPIGRGLDTFRGGVAGTGATSGAPGNRLVQAAQEKKRQEEEAAAQIRRSLGMGQ